MAEVVCIRERLYVVLKLVKLASQAVLDNQPVLEFKSWNNIIYAWSGTEINSTLDLFS